MENPEQLVIKQEHKIIDSSFFFPKKPNFTKQGQVVDIATNYFRFKFLNSSVGTYFKYSVEFAPELPGDAKQMRIGVWSSAREKINAILGHTQFNNATAYARENVDSNITIETIYKDQPYTITIKWANAMDSSSVEALGLYKRLFNSLVRKLKFVEMRKSYFNPKLAKSIQEHNIELWPGFSPTINVLDTGILLNLSVVHRVLRHETALDLIKTIQKNFRSDNPDYRQAIEDAFKGNIVITRYNSDKTYILEGVDFDKNPQSTFTTKEGPTTYADYYKNKYGKSISNDQPLLIHKDNKDNIIHLIPELCYLSGITDNMRANFMLMKSIADITKGSAREKVNENVRLVDTILNNEECKKEIEKWGISINDKPIMLEGRRITAGNILMAKRNDGRRVEVPVDGTGDLDRQIQQEMYSVPPLENWAIVYNERDKETAITFVNTMQQVLGSFRVKATELKKFGVKSNNYSDWEQTVYSNLNPATQIVILLIPGSRGKGALYKDLKTLFMTKCPIPSQVVLAGTISKGKGVRSIVNKVLIQINAKTGGEPWAIDNLPFTAEPTMICGIDTYGKPGSKTQMLAFCATFNRTFTRYVSFLRTPQENCSLSMELVDCVKGAVENFTAINKIAPKHIILFRDALSQGSLKDKTNEDVQYIQEGIAKVGQNLNIKITYIMLSKKVNAKLFFYDKNRNDYDNCSPGTVIDEGIVNEDFRDFYVISQKSNQGVSQPTHYYIAYDDSNTNPNDIYSLIYKMSYLYYNWTGSVRVPSPYMYAKKMTRLIGEKLSDNKNGVMKPSKEFETKFKTLYFL